MYLKDVGYEELKAIIEYMYKGEVNVAQRSLPKFLKTAEGLQVNQFNILLLIITGVFRVLELL